MDKKSLSRTVLFFAALLLTNQIGFSNEEVYTIGAAVKNINTEKTSNSAVAIDNITYRTGSLRIQGNMKDVEMAVVSSYAVVDIIAPNFDSDGFSFIKAALKSGDDPSFQVLGNGTLKVAGDITITPPSSYEQSIIPQLETPKLSVGQGGAVFRGNVELDKGYTMKIGSGGSFEIEKGPSLFSNEDSSTLVIIRSNSIQHWQHHATVLIQQKRLPEQPNFESPHIEAFLGESSVFKVGPRGETEVNGGLIVSNHLLNGQYIQEVPKGKSDDILKLNGAYSSSPFNFISAQKKGSDIGQASIQMFAVDSEGSIHANGSISTNSNLSVLGNVFLHGRLQFIPTRIQGGALMVIDDISSKLFLEITNDSFSRGTNRIILNGTPQEGQLLLIMNSDADFLTGVGEIDLQPQSLSLLVFLSQLGWKLVGSSATGPDRENKVKRDAKESSSWFENLVGKKNLIHDSDEGVSPKQSSLYGESTIEKLLKVEGLDASHFIGDSIDFRGASVMNAALVNPTLDNLKHITVESIGVLSLTSQSSNRVGSDRLVSVDSRGMLASVAHLRWDDSSKELKVSAISSFGLMDMEIRSNVDFKNHRISNFIVEPGSILENVVIKGGVIEESIFRNVSAEGLRLGDVEMESASLKDLSQHASKGALLTVGIGGKVTVSDAFYQDNLLLSVKKDVRMQGSLDMCNNTMINVRIKSGIIEGSNIAIHAESVSTSALTLMPGATDGKSSTVNPPLNGRLVMINENGLLQRSGIDLFLGDGIGDVKVWGTLDFCKDISSPENLQRGSIKNAEIHGGSINGVKALEVAGKSYLEGEVSIAGDLFVTGAVTVSGSIFGGGPYVDVSDQRMKKDIQKLDKSVLQQLHFIDPVTYSWANQTDKLIRNVSVDSGSKSNELEIREIGFIAQDVEKIFPMLVYTDPNDGLKGVKYSRFVPILVAAVKELSEKVSMLQESHNKLLQDYILLSNRLSKLLDD